LPVTSPTILLVRHGARRGPAIRFRKLRAPYFEPCLQDIEQFDPNLRKQLHIWETGNPYPDLDGVRAILFLLQDPLRELYPDCFADAVELAQRAKVRGIRIVNPPEALSNSIKTEQARLWRNAGIETPRVAGFQDANELLSLADVFPFPAIVRSDRLHAQKSMHWCDTREQVDRLDLKTLAYPGSISQFIDTRQGFQAADPNSEWAKYFHKKRALVIGDSVCHAHLFFSTHPIVGSRSCTFGHYRSLNPITRYRKTRACRPHMRMDWAFFEQEPEHAALMVRACRTLGLEIAAIDYSTCADGRAVLWEANPHFALHMWPFNVLEGPRRVRERWQKYHRLMVDYFRCLLSPQSQPNAVLQPSC
jgi:hypothetical protein